MTARLLPRPKYAALALGVLLGFGFTAAGRAAINRQEWKNLQTLEVTAPGLIKVSLPASTLSSARIGLPDLRVLDAEGNEVPYVIDVPVSSSPVQNRPKGFRVQLEKLETRIVIETGAAQPIERIRLLSSAEGFVKAARVEISTNGADWELVADGLPLVGRPDASALILPMSSVRAAYVRITVDDWRTPAVPFTGALLDLARGDPVPSLPVTTRVLKREEFVGETVFSLGLEGRQLPLSSVQFSTGEPFFARVVTLTRRELVSGESGEKVFATGSIFRTRSNSEAPRDHLELPVNVITAADEVQVHVFNQDDAPLKIADIAMRRRPVWLIFNSRASGSFQLLTGNSRVEAPRYDLSRTQSEWSGLPETTAMVSPVTSNLGYSRPDPLSTVPLAGAPIDLAKWSFRKTIGITAAGVHEIELDRDVLAHGSRGFADLRVVQNGLQIPYLLEPTSMRRAIAVELRPAADIRSPRLSRWEIKLPQTYLPIDRLSLTTSSPLFSRSFLLYEWIEDSRGEKIQRYLSDALTWHRTPERADAQLTVPLTARPSTDMLFLETDNGDNPAITLVSGKAEHPVTRIVFRSDGRPTDLFYGARDAAAPRYDLQLIAAQLLTEERTPASLGPEIRTDGKETQASAFASRRASVLLWSSLGVAVAALLFAIARLLPKTPPPSSS